MNNKAILTVGTVILSEKNVLLVRHTKEASHQTDIFGLPAGKVSVHETIQEAATREVKEETGLSVQKYQIRRLPTAYCSVIQQKTAQKRMIYIVYYAMKFSGELRASKENIPQWVSLDELQSINLLPNVQNAVKEAVKVAKS